MRRLIALFAFLAVAACGGDSATNSLSSSIAGTYTLRSVNGAVLPYVEVVDNFKLELLSQTLTLTEGGSFNTQGTIRTTVNTQVSTTNFSDTGTYTRSGNALTLRTTSDSSTVTGTIAGGSLTVLADRLTYVFQK